MTFHPAFLIFGLSGCFVTPADSSCEAIPLPDPVASLCDDSDDMDGDGITDCDDQDVDGDDLRNGWDCSPLDPEQVDLHAGGRCDDPDDRGDGELVVAVDTTEIWEPLHTTLLLDAAAGSTTLSVGDGADFEEGDEILILNQQGEGAGTYEVVNVASANASSITVEPYLRHAYDATDLVRVQRVPHYDSVNVAGTLTTAGWDIAEGGGVILFRACGAVEVSGTIDMNRQGFGGGAGVRGNDALPTTGASWTGPSVDPETATDETEEYVVGARNGGGGGAPVGDVDELRDQNAGGAGGSFGSTGEYSFSSDGEKYAQPGEVYGSPDLTSWFLGSGGGAGAPDREEDGDADENVSGSGGAGGGLVALFARDGIMIAGTITANGQRGDDAESLVGTDGDGIPVGGEPGGGGGGSGGMLMLVSELIAVTATGSSEGLSVKWGEGGWPASGGEVVESVTVRGGKGGYGYIRLDAATLNTPGTITTSDDGPFEGDFSDWCWESEDVPERPCYTDEDGDGSVAWSCGGGDCDDDDDLIHPNATEILDDGIDQDCDGLDLCEDAAWLQGGLKTLWD